jgi:chromosome segregation ATPase
VLFLVPPEGSRAYQNWEWCLNYLRTEQGRRRLVQQQVERAEARLKSVEGELNALRTAHEELDTRLRRLADEVRGAHHLGDGIQRDRQVAKLRLGLARARENLSSSRLLERRRETFRLRLQGLRDHLEPQVYPGLWGRVNAFLDLQALSVASVAGEEFRKVPRSLARVATRLERQLAED